MNRSDILKLFLNYGTQIDQDALEILTENKTILDDVLKIGKGKLPSVITPTFLKTISSTYSNTRPEKLSTSDLSQIPNSRYGFLQDILIHKDELVNLISINKISENLKQFSIIGMVFEKGYTLTLEDTTGHATFEISKELGKYIVEDEVIGIVCERHDGVNEVKNVVYPDIPLEKEGKKAKDLESCIFILCMYMDAVNYNVTHYNNFLKWLGGNKNLKISILGYPSPQKEDILKIATDANHTIQFYTEKDIIKSPASVRIENINILLSHFRSVQRYVELWEMPIDTTLTSLLKKRNLNPVLTAESYNNSFLLKEVPDIIVCGGCDTAVTTNYKGTTIITCGSFNKTPVGWLIDLHTRETFKIDFS